VTRPTNPPTDALELRRRALERVQRAQPAPGAARSPEDLARLVHELEVHWVELELQNEELCRVKDGLEEASRKYADL